MDKLIYQSESAEISFIDDRNLVAVFKGYFSPEKTERECGKLLELILEHRIEGYISDTRRIKGTWTASNDWLRNHFFATAVENGMKRVAFLVPADAFGKFSLRKMTENAEGYAFVCLEDPQEARDWLLRPRG